MKKALSIVVIFIIFIIIFLLQANFFNWFTIAGVKPNLFIVLALFIGLYAGQRVGTIYGIILGIFLDVILGKNIGASTVMLGAVGFLGGYLDKNFSKDSRLTVMLMVAGVTAIYEIGSYIFNVAQFSINIEILNFAKILAIEVAFNVILTIIVYPLMQRAGYVLEDIFKGQKVLTRYF